MKSIIYFQFTKIYRNNIDGIYRFFYLKLNSYQLAEDFSSDVFTRFWDICQRGGLKDIKNPRAFLYKTARNLLADHYRKTSGSATYSTEEIKDILDSSKGPKEKMILGEELAEIQRVISGLKEEYQDIIIWHYLEDLEIREIAGIMDKSENAVRVSLHRAMSALKDSLKEIKNQQV